jgi:hypothetical protein
MADTKEMAEGDPVERLEALAEKYRRWSAGGYTDHAETEAALRYALSTLRARPTREEVARLGQIIRTMRQVYDAQLSEFDCELEDEDAALVASLQAEADTILASPPPASGGEGETLRGALETVAEWLNATPGRYGAIGEMTRRKVNDALGYEHTIADWEANAAPQPQPAGDA